MSQSEHAVLAPSSAYRVMNCEASLIYEQGLPEEEPSEYALEGTEAHDLAARILRGHAWQCSDEEMSAYVQAYAYFVQDYKEEFLKGADKEINCFIEQKFAFSELTWGTADFAMYRYINGKPEAVIIDLKYGKGVDVEAEGNWQLFIYLLCFQMAMGLAFEKATLIIYQPRTGGDPVSKWELGRKEIAMLQSQYQAHEDRMRQVIDGLVEPVLYAGEHCRFCRARGQCKKYEEFALDKLQIEEIGAPLDVNTISNEQKVQIFKYKKEIEHFLDAVAADLQEQLKKGRTIEGVKLVSSRQQRRWRSDVDVAEGLKELGVEEPFEQKLIGIGAAERITGKNRIDNLCELTSAKPQLALSSDKRAAISGVSELNEIEEI